MIKRLLASMLSITIASTSFADMGSNMGAFFNSVGMNGNTTDANVYQDQSASFYSGGSLYARNQEGNIQIAQIDMPSISSGCGGIDAFLGGFSFVSTAQITAFVKKIMASSTGYMFDLALETTVPELKSVKDYIQKLANEVNSLNVNSCEAAQDVVGGLWPKTQATNRKICEDIGSQGGSVFSDWAAARQGCGTGGKADSTLDGASTAQKKEILKNQNLIWNNLQSYGGLGSDTSLAEFLMSITGTIIFDNNGKAKFYPAQITDKSFVNSFLYGTDGTIKGKEYHCDNTTTCLAPAVVDLNISKPQSFFAQVQSMVDQIRESIRTDAPLTDKEKEFIAASPVPVMKYIMVEQEAGIGESGVEDNTVVDVLAKSILIKFFETSIQRVRDSLASNGYSEDIASKLAERVDFASREVQSLKNDNTKMLQEIEMLNQHYQFIEKHVSAGMSADLKANSNF